MHIHQIRILIVMSRPDVDPYIAGGNGAQWYNDTNNFFRSVRNFVIDLTEMPATSSATGLHWQVSQGTSLYNIVVEMSTASDTAHQGALLVRSHASSVSRSNGDALLHRYLHGER